MKEVMLSMGEPLKISFKKRFFNEVYLPTLKDNNRLMLFYGG